MNCSLINLIQYIAIPRLELEKNLREACGVIVPTGVSQCCGVSSPSVRHISKHDSYRLLGLRIVSKKGSKVFSVHSLPAVWRRGAGVVMP